MSIVGKFEFVVDSPIGPLGIRASRKRVNRVEHVFLHKTLLAARRCLLARRGFGPRLRRHVHEFRAGLHAKDLGLLGEDKSGLAAPPGRDRPCVSSASGSWYSG